MPRFRPKNFVLLDVGQSLKPGETTTDHTSYVVQGDGYYEYVDAVGHIEERVPGTFTRPWRAPDTWVFTKDLAEEMAYADKASRESPRRYMTNAEYRHEQEFARAVRLENPEYRPVRATWRPL